MQLLLYISLGYSTINKKIINSTSTYMVSGAQFICMLFRNKFFSVIIAQFMSIFLYFPMQTFHFRDAHLPIV